MTRKKSDWLCRRVEIRQRAEKAACGEKKMGDRVGKNEKCQVVTKKMDGLVLRLV
jgi:hypothetical protein